MKILLIVSLLSGCETLASRDAAAGCQMADAGSTYYALHRNPTLEEQNSIPVNVLTVLKLALAAYIKWGDNHWEEAPTGVRIFITAVGCGAAISNVRAANR